MTWPGKREELKKRRQAIGKAGGAEKVARQHAAGKLTARERLEILCDPGSFREIDAFVQHRNTAFGLAKVELPADGVVTGFAAIEGRPICVAAQDFTVMGGSLGELHAQKISKIMDLAGRNGVPFIMLNDSGGARIQEGVEALKGYGEIFCRNTMLSGVIPQLAVVMGPSSGGAVYSSALADFTFMVKGTSDMFITGPEVVKASTGAEVSAEYLGGAQTHAEVSGAAHFVGDSETEVLQLVRRFLGYLPSNNLEAPERIETGDDPGRRTPGIEELVPVEPHRPYDMHMLIEEVVDQGTFLEIQPFFAPNLIIGLGRMHGDTAGVIANQPTVLAGVLDIDASDKAARFIRFCDAFNIPLLTFVDVPGYLPGVAQEHGGIIRHGAKLLYAYSEASVPKIAVIVRKAYGGAYIAMSSRHLGADFVLALPTAEIAVLGAEGAANIIFRKEINEAADPVLTRQEKIEHYRQALANPYVAASRGYVDDVIDPAEVRFWVIQALALSRAKRESRPGKKHGNIPL